MQDRMEVSSLGNYATVGFPFSMPHDRERAHGT